MRESQSYFENFATDFSSIFGKIPDCCSFKTIQKVYLVNTASRDFWKLDFLYVLLIDIRYKYHDTQINTYFTLFIITILSIT